MTFECPYLIDNNEVIIMLVILRSFLILFVLFTEFTLYLIHLGVTNTYYEKFENTKEVTWSQTKIKECHSQYNDQKKTDKSTNNDRQNSM